MIQMPMFESVPERQTWSEMVLSVSTEQDTIIRNILGLYNDGQPFDADATYSKGVFYKNLPQPTYKFDLTPQVEGVQQADARDLPLPDSSIGSLMFDPPFKASNSKVKGLIEQRFTAFRSVEDLWAFYKDAMTEFWRVLRPGGSLVVKCQDVVSSGKNVWSHREIERYAQEIGYEQLDLFILRAKSVMWSPNMVRQRHARKAHSFLFVFRKPNGKSKKSTNR